MLPPLSEFLDRVPSDNEVDELLLLDDENSIDELIKISKSVAKKNWGGKVQCYYPGRLFPSISLTGKECSMNCKHCDHHYLEGMIPADTPSKLTDVCMKLDKEGSVGCLISGGFTPEGSLPLKEFIPTLQKIKKKTKLIINIHTGFIPDDVAERVASTGIDAASVDVAGSNETIQRVYGISKNIEDYTRVLTSLRTAGLKNVAPHICIGLDYGKLKGEGEAIKIVRNNGFPVLTFIALNPTKGTQMQDIKPPSSRMIAKVISVARLALPNTSISLGCMRPVGNLRADIDYLSVIAGANRIAVPTPASIRRLESEYHFERHQTCCVI